VTVTSTATRTLTSTRFTLTDTHTSTAIRYVEGPRLGNTVWKDNRCSGVAYHISEAESLCNADTRCSVLHDVGCDSPGGGWRYCSATSSVQDLLAADTTTGACSLVVDEGTSITWTSTNTHGPTNTNTLASTTETTTTTVNYISGPRVGNAVFNDFCSSAGYALSMAQALCNADPSCTVLHDSSCNSAGGGWRYCSAPISEMLAADTRTEACTLVVEMDTTSSTLTSTSATLVSTTETSSTTVIYVSGPRVGNTVWQSHCSSTGYHLSMAQVLCNANPSCSVLHDSGCNSVGAGWRYCSASVQDLLAADTTTGACTLVCVRLAVLDVPTSTTRVQAPVVVSAASKSWTDALQ
jgi:hypothetical protein